MDENEHSISGYLSRVVPSLAVSIPLLLSSLNCSLQLQGPAGDRSEDVSSHSSTKQILNYTIQSSECSSECVCIGGLTPNARYEVCLRVVYEDSTVDTVCGRAQTQNEDVKTEDTCTSWEVSGRKERAGLR